MTKEEIKRLKKQSAIADTYKIVTNGDDVWWIDDKNTQHGYGYWDNKKQKIGLIRCPACHKENYMMSVSSGLCTWCPFEANK